MRKVYIQAKSKVEINERVLADNAYGIIFHPNGTERCNLRSLDDGDIVVRYTKRVGGNPFPEAYFTWDANKKRCK
jgi:hypothetical protein